MGPGAIVDLATKSTVRVPTKSVPRYARACRRGRHCVNNPHRSQRVTRPSDGVGTTMCATGPRKGGPRGHGKRVARASPARRLSNTQRADLHADAMSRQPTGFVPFHMRGGGEASHFCSKHPAPGFPELPAWRTMVLLLPPEVHRANRSGHLEIGSLQVATFM